MFWTQCCHRFRTRRTAQATDPREEVQRWFNTLWLRPRQNGRHFPDDIFKCIFLNENAWILIKISLKFVPEGSINNIPALVQIMAWRRPGAKPLSEPMLVRIPTHICVTRPQWVKIHTVMLNMTTFHDMIKSYPYCKIKYWKLCCLCVVCLVIVVIYVENYVQYSWVQSHP